jgi:putative ABC transport system ATP-binding protein
MNAPAPVLQMSGVAKSFPSAQGRVEVLRRIDLCVEPAEFLMITGPSGSGKTTLLHLAALLEAPTSGRVLFENRELSGADETELCALRRQRIGIVFQRFCLLPHRSVLANVLFRFRYTGVPRSEARDRAEAALAELGLSAILHRPVRLLSAGEMQRVAIARAAALPPALLLADEPTGNLDRAAADAVMESFQRLHRQGITILMVTHNAQLLSLATRHLLCRDGELTC